MKEPVLVVYKDNASNSGVSFSSDEDKRSVESRVSADGADFSVNNGWYCSYVFFFKIKYLFFHRNLKHI